MEPKLLNPLETPNTADPTVEIEPFTFFFSLTNKLILSNRVQVNEIGLLKVEGEATRTRNALGEPTITVDVKWVKFGVDIKPVLIHWGHMEEINEAALKHATEVTFAPKATKESVLKAIKHTVCSLRGFEPLTITGHPITIRLSDNDHHLAHVEGLVVTIKGQLIVLDGSGAGHPLELTEVYADKMLIGIYKGLEKRFPNQVKAIV